MTAIPHNLAHAREDQHDHAHRHAHELGFVKQYIFPCDHKLIGIQFLVMGLLFMILGVLLAMLIRWQLAWPDPVKTPGHPVPILGSLMGWANGHMPPEFYMMVMTMHATIMIFFVIIVLLVGTFGNYLIPLKIGAGDMAFPFLNGLAFWSAWPAGAIMLAGFFVHGNAASAGWTSYPPLSAMQYNNAGNPIVFAGNLLQIQGSTWPMLPIFMQFIAQALLIGYICCWYVHVGNKSVNRALGVLLSIVGGIIMTRAVQHISFDGQSCWFFSLFWLGF